MPILTNGPLCRTCHKDITEPYNDDFCSKQCSTYDLGTVWMIYKRDILTNTYSVHTEIYPSETIAQAEAKKMRDRAKKLNMHTRLYGVMSVPHPLPLTM